MTRRLLNLLTALSLLLCVALAAMWVRSYWVSEDFNSHGFRFFQRYGPIAYAFGLRSGAGGLWLNVVRPDAPPTPKELDRIRDNFLSTGWEIHRFAPVYPRLWTTNQVTSSLGGTRPAPLPQPPQPLSWRLLGVDWKVEASRTDFATYTVYRVVFPYWMPTALLGLIPALRLLPALRRRKARARSARGLCPSCGYDLRATRGRCPECGILIRNGSAESSSLSAGSE